MITYFPRKAAFALAFTAIALPSLAQVTPPPPQNGHDVGVRAENNDQALENQGITRSTPPNNDGRNRNNNRGNPPPPRPSKPNNPPTPPQVPQEPSTLEQIELGQALFFDKELSGNRNISCASCHHPNTHTGDELSLPIGEGGEGLGLLRNTGLGLNAVVERVPRNSPALFNLGRANLQTLFHDGRISVDTTTPSGFNSPAGDELPLGLNNIIAAQALFPVTSATEMAGQAGENEIADAVSAEDLASPLGVWELLAQRLRNIPAYVTLFQAAYPTEVAGAEDISFTMAANAIATFETSSWAANNSPFDRQMAGEVDAMSEAALRGMAAFQENGCAGCHRGNLQTDEQFHAIAMPQIGPGKGDNSEGFNDGREDFGRERVTGNEAHRFQFRTPSLRNVELSAPYGHAGAYQTLEAMVRHYINPVNALNNYDRSQVQMPARPDLDALDFVVMDNSQRLNEIAQAARDEGRLRPRNLSEQEVSDILAFLAALTDPASVNLLGDVPSSVPSGLSLID